MDVKGLSEIYELVSEEADIMFFTNEEEKSNYIIKEVESKINQMG
tara:strand:+ start:87 stop:221 length:135 start_codon:yes stop_codon:yes gene_type:complete